MSFFFFFSPSKALMTGANVRMISGDDTVKKMDKINGQRDIMRKERTISIGYECANKLLILLINASFIIHFLKIDEADKKDHDHVFLYLIALLF